MFFKRVTAVLFVSLMLSGGLYAQFDQQDIGFKFEDLNETLKVYIDNISKLIPDSVTTQNMWSYAPRSDKGIFGFGVNMSLTMADRAMLASLTDGSVSGFGGSETDLTNFPESIPYLPAGAFDLRFGGNYVDFGITGMWISAADIPELSDIVGEDSDYTPGTIGFDIRLALLTDGVSRFFGIPIDFIPRKAMPAVTLQAGYYFTNLLLGFKANNGSETINMDFRNDAYFMALQISKTFGNFITPYVGGKLIASSTITEFSWSTERPVEFNDVEYPNGLTYFSGTNARDSMLYFHVYGGIGLNLLFDHLLTIGVAYNVNSGHFAVNAAVRLLF